MKHDYSDLIRGAQASAATDTASEAQLARMIDHTTLAQTDSQSSVRAFTERAMGLTIAPATICVYPSMIETVGITLGESPIGVTAVCGAFPSGQTYMEVKLLEVAMAIENGADEIDIVANIGELLMGEHDMARSEIRAIKDEAGDDALLKVILEVGALVSPELIYRAAMVAMESGADFVKTSTGKIPVGATPASVAVMCRAVGDYYQQTGRRVGIKCAGGITTIPEALTYFHLVRQMLGEEWLTPSLMRIGSSKLAYQMQEHSQML